jgi:hypothetical protein
VALVRLRMQQIAILLAEALLAPLADAPDAPLLLVNIGGGRHSTASTLWPTVHMNSRWHFLSHRLLKPLGRAKRKTLIKRYSRIQT